MDVEVVEHEEDSASAARGEGGADGRAPARPSGGDGAHARPSDAAASAARQASAGDITRMFSILVSISTEISCHCPPLALQ